MSVEFVVYTLLFTTELQKVKEKKTRILQLRNGMQTSKMSNKPKLSEPSPLQTSIVLWRQIKTMFLVCKSSGPHSAQIKVAEPIGMLKSLCSNQCADRIKPQNGWSARKVNWPSTGVWNLCVWDNFTISIWLHVKFQIFCSVCVCN